MERLSEKDKEERAVRLGEAVREFRKARGLTAVELSSRTGLSRSYISYLERGRFSEIGLDRFLRLLYALDLTADQVLFRAGILTEERELPRPRSYLASIYRLRPASLDTALRFLDFLQREDAEKTRAKK